MVANLKSAVLNEEITSTSPTARQSDYTANNGDCKIDQVTVNNTNGIAYDVYLYISSGTDTTGTLQHITKVQIGANAEAQLPLPIGHVVPSGGSIQYHAGFATGIYITISAIEKLPN